MKPIVEFDLMRIICFPAFPVSRHTLVSLYKCDKHIQISSPIVDPSLHKRIFFIFSLLDGNQIYHFRLLDPAYLNG